jgi:hypothetical protein
MMDDMITALSPAQHGDYGLHPDRSFAHAANWRSTPLGLSEILEAAGCFPLFLMKSEPSGTFRLNALLGLSKPCNLYCRDGGWGAAYIPLNLLRYPFVLGENDDAAPLLCADFASPSLVRDDLEALRLYDERGAPSPLLDDALRLLLFMRKDHQETIPFIARLLSCHLIRRKDIELTHQKGATSQITGLYGIDEEALADLDGAHLQSLNLDQYLGLIFAMLQSERHLQRLLHLAIRRGDNLVSAHLMMS